MGKRFKELRGRVSEEAPVNSVGTSEAVSTNVPVVRKPLKRVDESGIRKS